MKKQNYILAMIGMGVLATIFGACSAPSTNTAANVSNKTNANVAMSNANGAPVGTTSSSSSSNTNSH